MRVFYASDIVDRPSDRLYVRTITLSGWIDRRSHDNRLFSRRGSIAPTFLCLMLLIVPM